MVANTLFTLLESTIGSNLVLLTIFPFSIIVKIALFGYFLVKWQKEIFQRVCFFLLLLLISSIVIDFAWLMQVSSWEFGLTLGRKLWAFLFRITWASTAIYYLALPLFVESLISRNDNLSVRQKIFIFISFLFALFFICLIIFDFDYCSTFCMSKFVLPAKKALLYYSFFILMPTSLFSIVRKLKKENVPRILKKQAAILLLVFIVPVIISDFIHLFPFNFPTKYAANCYSVLAFSTVLFSCALFYAMKKLLRLRFLNINKHVQSVGSFSFVNDLDEVTKQLSFVKHTCELEPIARNMLSKIFGILHSQSQLHIRSDYYQQDTWGSRKGVIEAVECLFCSDDEILSLAIKKERILIYDEIEFDCLCEQTDENRLLLEFMDKINADIFLPIYKKNKFTGYLIIERGARGKKFYGSAERTELLVFTQTLTTAIYAIHQEEFQEVVYRSKRKDEIIFSQHQEINQSRESNGSFLHDMNERKIGIAYYHNKRFTFGNEMAENFISIDLNVQIGHHITKALKKLAQSVRQYRVPKSIFITDSNGHKLVVTAMIQYERFDVLLIMHHPNLSDIITKRMAVQSDPSKIDYILYLETTKAGRLVDQLLPGSGKILLNFKITLLKAALSNKAVLLDTHKDDTIDCVRLLNNISLREKLHFLKLTHNQKNNEDSIELFGMNPLFLDESQPQKVALLERLDKIGTLFIENIHFLSIKAQERLADYICYGFFFVFKSEKCIYSNVRIICSSDQDLEELVNEGLFSPLLFKELQRTAINMPSLSLLPEDELKELISGFEDQLLQQKEFKDFLTLTEKDKAKFVRRRPTSIGELQEDVKELLEQKSKENNIYEETVLDPTYGITDPELIAAVRLGKRALQDPKVMAMLMKKFDNNQSKIATFLGVNRSSVNRRFKKYDYTDTTDKKTEKEKK